VDIISQYVDLRHFNKKRTSRLRGMNCTLKGMV